MMCINKSAFFSGEARNFAGSHLQNTAPGIKLNPNNKKQLFSIFCSMKHQNLFVALLLTASLVLFSLGIYKKYRHSTEKDNTASSRRIAVIPKGTANMWWEVVRKGAEKAAAEAGISVSWNGPELETDREKQIQCVEDALTRNVDAVVLGPNDFRALARSVEKIHARNIPCIIIDSPVESTSFDSFVATDNYQGGAEAAKILGAALGSKGNVIVISYVPNSASTDARSRGFTETIAKDFPGIKILSNQYTLGTVEDARQKTVDLLTRFPETSGVFAVNHPSSVGSFKAITSQNFAGKIKFVAFDSDPVLLDGVAAGFVEAIIAQNPFEIGYRGVKCAIALLDKKTVENFIPIAGITVTKANLDRMKEQYPQALGL